MTLIAEAVEHVPAEEVSTGRTILRADGKRLIVEQVTRTMTEVHLAGKPPDSASTRKTVEHRPLGATVAVDASDADRRRLALWLLTRANGLASDGFVRSVEIIPPPTDRQEGAELRDVVVFGLSDGRRLHVTLPAELTDDEREPFLPEPEPPATSAPIVDVGTPTDPDELSDVVAEAPPIPDEPEFDVDQEPEEAR